MGPTHREHTISSETVTDFTTVDSSNDTQFFLRFLDAANKLPTIATSKQIILDGLRLRNGGRVLDLGCGLGDDTFQIAERVGPSGRVTGVDVSTSMIEEARRRAEGRGLPVDFEVGDSQALRFLTGTFDGVRAERMLMHVPDAERAIAEMARVLAPGGRISVFDFDWETQVCDSPYRETTARSSTASRRLSCREPNPERRVCSVPIGRQTGLRKQARESEVPAAFIAS
jgi:ubiquinone/menaquinone biosynthesis C-methylase UbiE